MPRDINVTIQGGIGRGAIDSGSLGTMPGGQKSKDFTITQVTTDQTASLSTLSLYVKSDPSFDADYAFNHEWSQNWNDSESQIDVDVTVNWDTDPGNNNDIDLEYVLEE